MIVSNFTQFENRHMPDLNGLLHVFVTSAKKTKRKAVSEIIATTLLLGITVVGAIMISVMFQNTLGNAGSGFNSAALQNNLPPAVKMTGYDARDGNSLFNISGFNNKPNSELCTDSCKNNNDAVPASDGTEFIVLRIKNEGTDSYVVEHLLVNDIEHLWDDSVGAIGTLSLVSPEIFPKDGKFGISLASDPTTLRNSNIILSGEEVLLIIKLNDKLIMGGTNPDVSLNVPLVVEFTGSLNAPTFVIFSGDAI